MTFCDWSRAQNKRDEYEKFFSFVYNFGPLRTYVPKHKYILAAPKTH